MKQNYTDVIIIGSGPIGLACGIEAVKHDFSHRIIDKGCLVNSLYNYPTNMTFFSTSDRLEIGGVPFISHGFKPTRSEALEYYRRVTAAWDLNVNVYEKVTNIAKNDDLFTVETDKDSYNCKYTILATGFYDQPNMMKVPGEDLPKVRHYYDEPHPYAFQKVVVVGAGNSAVDAALETFRHGAEVTMVIREPELSPTVKYWVRPDIENRIEEGSITAHFNSTISKITENEILINTQQGNKTVENDFVLAMTGYHPDYEFLHKIGIQITPDERHIPECNPESHESCIKNLFIAGVMLGGMETYKWTIENSREHAVKIFNYLKSKRN